MANERVVVVANRLPVSRNESGSWETSPGGLVSALTPILRESDGAWIGWPGVPDDNPEPFVHDRIAQYAVPLSRDLVDAYYLGFCNATLWPLYHDAIRSPEFDHGWWHAYEEANRQFAEAAAAQYQSGDLVWVHDYQLQLVPGMLRRLRPDARIGFFLHIPFPPVEIFARLPWRTEVLTGLLGADVVAFQTEQALHNFMASVDRFTDAVVGRQVAAIEGRRVDLHAAPISVDTAALQALAASPHVRERATHLRAELGEPRAVLLGADRLDYTKGIDARLLAFETLLQRRAADAENVIFLQIASPSREPIDDYEAMRTRIEQLVGRINGSHGRVHTAPVHYVYGSLSREELVAYLVAADVMCVTPFADGMNLVAKEYVAARPADTGALVLSEFAGAAAELDSALLVNPYDVEGMADTLAAAIDLPPSEQAARMKRMRERVRLNDVHAWADLCLSVLGGEGLPRPGRPAGGEVVRAVRRFRAGAAAGLPDALEAFDEIAAALRGRRVMAFLDFDGTLSPIVEDPDQAEMPEAERRAVEALADRIPVAIVSGRDVDDVRERVGLPGLYYVGGHGFDIVGPDGTLYPDSPGEQFSHFAELLDSAEQGLRRRLEGTHPGVLIERKRFSVAVHYRQAPQALRDLRAAVEETATKFTELQVLPGRAVLELRPTVPWDKGAAVRWLIQKAEADRLPVPVYLGDDTTDETAFRAIEEDGIGIIVREGVVGTAAGYRLRSRDRVAAFLGQLAEVVAPAEA